MNEKKAGHISHADKADKIYLILKEEHALDVVLYYFKTSIIHIGFEAVITVLYVVPFVLYSDAESLRQTFSLPMLFGKVLLNCALIFSIVVFGYLLALYVYIMISLRQIKGTEVEIYKHIRRISFFGIIAGIIIYFAGGITVANHPGWFTGMEPVDLSPAEMFKVGARITGLGLIWAFQSSVRYQRVKYIIKRSTSKSVYPRLKSVTAMAFVMCIIAFLLLYAFKRIPTPSSEMFDYYNLILAIYFGIYSAYVTVCYKLEIREGYPNEP